MKSKIMVLFNSATIRREALQYSIELAKRMKSALILLMILSFEICSPNVNDVEPIMEMGMEAEESLKKHVQIIRDEGIPVETAVRIGNPRSELVKYVAEAGRFEIIVWGATPGLIKKKNHWFVQMKDILECPVVTPFIKNDTGATHPMA
jgi:nucleotide-binding universal stress UspA family protein